MLKLRVMALTITVTPFGYVGQVAAMPVAVVLSAVVPVVDVTLQTLIVAIPGSPIRNVEQFVIV